MAFNSIHTKLLPNEFHELSIGLLHSRAPPPPPLPNSFYHIFTHIRAMVLICILKCSLFNALSRSVASRGNWAIVSVVELKINNLVMVITVVGSWVDSVSDGGPGRAAR